MSTSHVRPTLLGHQADQQWRAASDEAHPRKGRPAGLVPLVLAAVLAIAVIFVCFALPAAKSTLNQVPLGVSGPPEAVSTVTAQLDRMAPNAWAARAYPDEAALEQAIRQREVYGGLAVGATGPRAMTASAASPVVAQAVNSLAVGMGQQLGRPVPVTDLVGLPAGDPRGAGLAAAAFPLALAGLLPAVLLATAVPLRRRWQAVGLLSASALSALVISSVLRFWFGSVEVNFWPVTGLIWLGLSAVGLFVLGCSALAGRVGMSAASALIMLLGNPLSGLSSAPEVLPAGWGAFGQLLPPGALATALRSVAFFDGAGATRPLVILACWAAVGAALLWAGRPARLAGAGHHQEASPVS